MGFERRVGVCACAQRLAVYVLGRSCCSRPLDVQMDLHKPDLILYDVSC